MLWASCLLSYVAFLSDIQTSKFSVVLFILDNEKRAFFFNLVQSCQYVNEQGIACKNFFVDLHHHFRSMSISGFLYLV